VKNESSQALFGYQRLVFRKNSIRASRSDFLKPIFMMKSAEDGGASNGISGRNTMPMSALLRKRT